jgi:hypothetical protein
MNRAQRHLLLVVLQLGVVPAVDAATRVDLNADCFRPRW